MFITDVADSGRYNRNGKQNFYAKFATAPRINMKTMPKGMPRFLLIGKLQDKLSHEIVPICK